MKQGLLVHTYPGILQHSNLSNIISTWFNLVDPQQIRYVSGSHPCGDTESADIYTCQGAIAEAPGWLQMRPLPLPRWRKVNRRLKESFFTHLESPFPADLPDTAKHHLALLTAGTQTSAPLPISLSSSWTQLPPYIQIKTFSDAARASVIHQSSDCSVYWFKSSF